MPLSSATVCPQRCWAISHNNGFATKLAINTLTMGFAEPQNEGLNLLGCTVALTLEARICSRNCDKHPLVVRQWAAQDAGWCVACTKIQLMNYSLALIKVVVKRYIINEG